jgi:hypothetical protein
MQKARRHYPIARAPTACRRMVSGSFHSLLRVLFTFPLRYWFAIGLPVVFRLTRWCWQIQTGFLRPALLRILLGNACFSLTGLSPSVAMSFQNLLLKYVTSTAQSYNPNGHAHWFGLFRFRSPLLTESLLVFFSSAYLDVSVQRVCDFWLHVFNLQGCPIRTSTDQRSFAPPRSFSQLTTSFVASGSQGIPHTPLFASISLIHPETIKFFSRLLTTRHALVLGIAFFSLKTSLLSFALSMNFYILAILIKK